MSKPPSPNETKPTQFRLSPESLAMLDEIIEHRGLSNRTEAVRHAIKVVRDMCRTAQPKGRPKGSKAKPKPPPA